jgi:phosphate:Na+ symporter
MLDRRRAKTALRWLLTAAVVAYAVGDCGGSEPRETPQPSDEPGAASVLRITSISDADVNPGDAIVVKFAGAEGTAPITARIAGQPADILVRKPASVVVRIPHEVAMGKAGMRLVQGERRSKSWDLHIQPTNHRKLLARLLGGLALFVYGLGLLAGGLRGLTGQRVRAALGRLTRSPPKAVGMGMLVGAVTQLTSSAAALTVSLVEARLLALAPSIAILVGAQLGASITGALLPVALAQESLLVIAIGVLWTRLSTGRRAHAVAEIVLGIGLMLYGVHLLQTSVDPLVTDPKLLPFLEQLRGAGIGATLSCAATGAVLALVLQGPGPVFVLVVGLVHVSDALPLANALAILAGTCVGAAVGMSLIAWQSGRATRALAGPHLLFGTAATLALLVSLPLWVALADSMFGATSAMAVRLAVVFGASQVLFTGLWLIVLPSLVERVRRRPKDDVSSAVAEPETLARTAREELARGLERQQLVADIALETSCTGDRARSAESEEALIDARRRIEGQYATLGSAAPSPAIDRVIATLVASLQLLFVVEQLSHVTELGVERGLKLTTDEQARLRAIHVLTRESFDVLIEALVHGVPPDIEAAGAREIRTNQLEAEGRTSARVIRRKNDSSSLHLGISEIIDSYEHLGNHLFRVTKSLAGDSDDLL